MLKKNTSGLVLEPFRDHYLIYLDTAVISGQKYTRLQQTLFPSKGFSVLTALSVTGKCPEALLQSKKYC